MNLVLANAGFDGAGGTECYLLTLAEQLIRLGHTATIYTRNAGRHAEHARTRGVEVHDATEALPEHADVILTQDAIVAYDLRERYPAAFHVFRACSDVYDFELPPQLQNVVDLVLVNSDRYARLVKGTATAPPVLRLRTPIDVERLVPLSAPRAAAQRIVLLGNYPDRHDLVTEAWGGPGIEIVQVGGATPSFDVTHALAGADIVVAKARAALDAMSCGRPVYLHDCFGGDGWVTPDAYPALEADNFAGQATDRIIDAEQMRADLAAYHPRMGRINRDLVLQHHDARAHAIALLTAIAERQPATPAHHHPTDPLAELARLTALQWTWEQRARGLAAEVHALHARLQTAEHELAEAHRDHA